MYSVLPVQAASSRDFAKPWKPRPGDGISSGWLIAELTHYQGLEHPMEADRGPTPASHWRFGRCGSRIIHVFLRRRERLPQRQIQRHQGHAERLNK